MQASFEKPKGHPVDYFVPNFGPQDVDIADTWHHTQETEAALGHVMTASFKDPKGHPKDYFVPNFGPQESDIKDTQDHIASSESSLNHVMTASFKEPKGHKKDYFVPNFGLDHDILAAQSNIAQAQAKIGHVWSPDNADISAADNSSYNYAAVQTDAQIRLGQFGSPSIESPGCFCSNGLCTDECESPSKF